MCSGYIGKSAEVPWAWVPRVVSGGIGVILLAGGLSKVFNFELFIRQMGAYHIVTDPLWLAVGAWGLTVVQCGLGAALLLFYRPWWSLVLTMGMWAVLLGATGWTTLTDVTSECGCFGPWLRHSPLESSVANAILLAFTLIALLMLDDAPAARPGRFKGAAVALACALGLVLPVLLGSSLPILKSPLDRAVAGPTPRATVQALSDANVSRGNQLLVLMRTTCPHYQESVPAFNELAQLVAPTPAVAIFAEDEAAFEPFAETFGLQLSRQRVSRRCKGRI